MTSRSAKRLKLWCFKYRTVDQMNVNGQTRMAKVIQIRTCSGTEKLVFLNGVLARPEEIAELIRAQKERSEKSRT